MQAVVQYVVAVCLGKFTSWHKWVWPAEIIFTASNSTKLKENCFSQKLKRVSLKSENKSQQSLNPLFTRITHRKKVTTSYLKCFSSYFDIDMLKQNFRNKNY